MYSALAGACKESIGQGRKKSNHESNLIKEGEWNYDKQYREKHYDGTDRGQELYPYPDGIPTGEEDTDTGDPDRAGSAGETAGDGRKIGISIRNQIEIAA